MRGAQLLAAFTQDLLNLQRAAWIRAGEQIRVRREDVHDLAAPISSALSGESGQISPPRISSMTPRALSSTLGCGIRDSDSESDSSGPKEVESHETARGPESESRAKVKIPIPLFLQSHIEFTDLTGRRKIVCYTL